MVVNLFNFKIRSNPCQIAVREPWHQQMPQNKANDPFPTSTTRTQIWNPLKRLNRHETSYQYGLWSRFGQNSIPEPAPPFSDLQLDRRNYRFSGVIRVKIDLGFRSLPWIRSFLEESNGEKCQKTHRCEEKGTRSKEEFSSFSPSRKKKLKR